MIRVIIESPLRGATGSPEEYERNRIYARRCARYCLLNGMAPFASHLIYDQPGIFSDHVPEERALGITAGLAWAKSADDRIFFLDYGWSSGMLRARTFYDGHALPWREMTIGTNYSNECCRCFGLGFVNVLPPNMSIKNEPVMACSVCRGKGRV